MGWSSRRSAQAGRKVRAPQDSIAGNARPPLEVRTSGTETSRLNPSETAKLYAVQAQIGGKKRSASLWIAGRVLEVASNGHPREMTVSTEPGLFDQPKNYYEEWKASPILK